MANQLRQAIEIMKQYYINKLIDAGVFNAEDCEPYNLTVSELEMMVQRLPKA
ncbi:Fur-regulated basic protein FbpA [Thalassobacillus sp. CUG 92003]|uniref:Fur-regulated basic protein FbpA n=1 Tax=Thalassobacillus sp. CUG 92003 TaxID=2736641 RepID=UPI0015E76B39|nr:Fur-regulated basic protein FbpA [Thalassobacillus sp. CUG 92003]